MASEQADGKGFFGRLWPWRQDPVPAVAPGEPRVNLLVVSDIHLGETAKERSRIEFLKHTEGADREFCRFLEYHRAYRPGGLPWQLVLAGDVFDLVAAPLTPDRALASARHGLAVSEEERRRGLDNSESRIAWKLERILDRHPAWVSYLADFVASGNRLLLMAGNHDAELYWPAVHGKLVERLVDAYFGGEEVEGITPAEFVARIEFSPWLFHVPGLVHIQHGHQYDAYCALLRPLYPLRPGQEELMELSSTSILIRYGLAQVRGVRSHDKDEFSFGDYLRWMGRLPRGKAWELIRAYARAVREQVGYWRAVRRADPTSLEERFQAALLREAGRQGLSPATLQALAGLAARPANLGYDAILSSMFLDTILTVVAAPFLLLAWLLLAPGRWPRKVLGGAAILGGTALALHLFSTKRGSTEVSPRLVLAARRIAPVVKTPFVVMGHSHKAELTRLSDEATFANSGSWLLPDEPAPLHGDRCDCPLTYLELTALPAQGTGEAKLLRWCQREGRPVLVKSEQRPLSS